jgi:hypothetical protein
MKRLVLRPFLLIADGAFAQAPQTPANKYRIKGATENGHGQFAAKAKKAGESTLAFAHEHDDAGVKLGKEALLAENRWLPGIIPNTVLRGASVALSEQLTDR